MTDPFEALVSFQQALRDGEVRLQTCELDPALFVYLDHPTGTPRFTYVRLDRRTVTALAMLVPIEPLDGLSCFHVGVAVPEAHRGKGYAKSVVAAAIAELRHGLARNKIPSFYIEAVVSVDNEPLKCVAAATISDAPTAITDAFSGQPALRYLRKI